MLSEDKPTIAEMLRILDDEYTRRLLEMFDIESVPSTVGNYDQSLAFVRSKYERK